MRTNVRATAVTPNFFTHEGAPAVKESAQKELVRAVSACLLFEDTFYESGNALAKRIGELVQQVPLAFTCALAYKARTDLKLRHAPLFLCVQALKVKTKTEEERSILGETIAQVIRRADELAEILSLYWKDRPAGGAKKLPRQLKKGVAKAFQKFDAYALAKYDRGEKVKLRDALFLTHPKPKDAEQDALWKMLIAGTMSAPDTWEVALSAGKDKGETFTRLIAEKKLGYMALLRNLRNMTEKGVDRSIIVNALQAGAAKSKALPFRFIAAARACPSMANELSEALLAAVAGHTKLPGLTYLLIDVSGSMDAAMSGKSDLSRMDAAAALATLAREVCASGTRVFTFSNDFKEVAGYRGLAMIDGVIKSQEHGGTYLGGALQQMMMLPVPNRIIVVTDEQAHDTIPPCWAKSGYILNVASYQPAIPVAGYGWTRISGFSERVIDWMMAEEEIPFAEPADDVV